MKGPVYISFFLVLLSSLVAGGGAASVLQTSDRGLISHISHPASLIHLRSSSFLVVGVWCSNEYWHWTVINSIKAALKYLVSNLNIRPCIIGPSNPSPLIFQPVLFLATRSVSDGSTINWSPVVLISRAKSNLLLLWHSVGDSNNGPQIVISFENEGSVPELHLQSPIIIRPPQRTTRTLCFRGQTDILSSCLLPY